MKFVFSCPKRNIPLFKANFEMKIDAADMKRYVSPVEFYNPKVPTPDYRDVTPPPLPPPSPPKTPDKARKRRQLHIKLPSLNNVPRVERSRRKYYKKDDNNEKVDIYVDTRKNTSPQRNGRENDGKLYSHN